MNLTALQQVGAFTGATLDAANRNFQTLFNLTFTPGNVIWCAPAYGSDQADGLTPDTAVQTLGVAYAKLRTGRNDVLALISDGASTGSARLSSAFTWAKDAAHLVGISSGTTVSNRSRIAPTAGVTAFANFFTVSASGCLFQNIQFYAGFGTGSSTGIAVTVSGGRNVFKGCHIAGMVDAASAQSANARSLKVTGLDGENMFVDCTIGADTVTRTQANASLELAGGTPRNQFIDCVFPFMGSAAGVLGILGTGNSCVDRWNLFKNCVFTNAIKSTSTPMTALASFTTNAPGGLLVFKNSMTIGITKWGDTNGLANSYIDMAQPAAASGGLGVNPT